jgi:phage-related protein
MKKRFYELKQVQKFISSQPQAVTDEYREIVRRLENDGRLSMPFGEKVKKELFAIRVINAGNIRVFYVYGYRDKAYGIHGYVKKTRQIPQKELKQAEKIIKLLRQEGLIK